MTDPNVAREAAKAEDNLPTTLKLASDAEAQATEWAAHLRSHPPANEGERQHYRTKAAEFRRFQATRLAEMEKTARTVAELLRRLDTAPGDDQVLILRKQLGSVLEGEAATARALASVLEVCLEIDGLTLA